MGSHGSVQSRHFMYAMVVLPSIYLLALDGVIERGFTYGTENGTEVFNALHMVLFKLLTMQNEKVGFLRNLITHY